MNHIRDYVDVSPSKAIELRRQAREYIRQTPRGVQVSTTSKAGELQVHWLRNNYEMVSRNYLEKKVCNVKLHSLSTCETRREDLIINTEHLSSARSEPITPPSGRSHSARDDPPVEEGLDRGMHAREEAISERIWQNEEFPQLRSIVLTPRTLCRCEENDMDMFLESSLYDSRLDIEFEKDRYYEIRDSSQCYPNYIAWVHDVHDGSAGCVQERHLSVTKFSILRQEHLFRGGTKLNESAEIADLMLHFSSVQHMGQQTDAEVVMIKDITFAKALSTSFRPKIEPELKESFLDPLDIMDSITKSNFDPDFQSFGCARQRYLVNTVASRFPGLAVVPIKLAAHRTEDDEFTLITDLIKDLSFLNPRQTESSEEAILNVRAA
ncbi:hypothetical protein K4K60_011276 [Colletotrichum sp. SAR11_57]|nr:hypothetical protein K4K60_011276 [Colletotrichum sp. SAR11_57]